jgi:hypothetical protein
MDLESFTHRWNDAIITYDEYKKLIAAHQEWVDAKEKQAAMVAEAEKPKRPKRSKKNT